MESRFVEFIKSKIDCIERALADLDGWYGDGIDRQREDYRHELGVRRAILAHFERLS